MRELLPVLGRSQYVKGNATMLGMEINGTVTFVIGREGAGGKRTYFISSSQACGLGRLYHHNDGEEAATMPPAVSCVVLSTRL